MSTMQAYRIHSYGGPEVLSLDTIPIPTLSSGQLLIRINKAGLNPFDWKIREGYVKDMMPLPLPYTLGVDFVGTVSALGSSSSAHGSKFKPGDRVMGFTEQLQAFATYKLIEDEAVLARVPEGLSDDQAMTLPIPALTAWQALHTAGELRSGMRVLIQGASGLVGAFAVQFAKNAGCYVFATASGKNKDFVLDLGADRFIDYGTESFETIVEDVDLMIDCVLLGGAMNPTNGSWDVVKAGGAIVSVADPAILGNIPEGKRGYFPRILPDGQMLENVAEQLVSDRLKAKVAEVFPHNGLVAAMEKNKKGGVAGRIMVDFSSV